MSDAPETRSNGDGAVNRLHQQRLVSLLLTALITGFVFLLCYIAWRLTATTFRGTFLGEFRFVARLAVILLLLIVLNPIIARLQTPLWRLIEAAFSSLQLDKAKSE